MNGNVVKSWHDTDGSVVNIITSAVLHDNIIYLGFVHEKHIAYVPY